MMVDAGVFCGQEWRWLCFLVYMLVLVRQQGYASRGQNHLLPGHVTPNNTQPRHHRHQQREKGDRDQHQGSEARTLHGDPDRYSWIAPWSWTVEDFPSPLGDPFKCGAQQLNSRVCDPNNILRDQEVTRLEAAISRVCTGTGCACDNNCSVNCNGFVIGVAVVTQIRQQSTTSSDGDAHAHAELADWAHYLRTHSWRLGTCDNDVIIVLHVNGRKISTSVGERCRAKLTRACSESVEHDAHLLLADARYAEALEQIIRGFDAVFHDDFKCVLSVSRVMTTGERIGLVLGVISVPALLCVILIFVGPCFKGRGFGGRKHKTNYNRYNRGQQVDYDSRVLPTVASFSPLTTPVEEVSLTEGPSTSMESRPCGPLRTRPGVHVASAVPGCKGRMPSPPLPTNSASRKTIPPLQLQSPSPPKSKPKLIEELTLEI